MGMEDLSIDMTYDPCLFSLDSTFKSRISCLGCPVKTVLPRLSHPVVLS
jgi:predicted proteasome-type protease